MNYPRITTIDDVLPYIKEKEKIKVKRHDNYITIDYHVQKEDTFDSYVYPIRADFYFPDEHKGYPLMLSEFLVLRD